MKLTKLMIAVGIFVMMFTLVSAAIAGHGRHGEGGPPGERMKAILEGLDLSESQKAKVDVILERHRGAQKALRESLGHKREALHNMIHAAEFNENAVRSAFQQVSSIEEELMVSRAKFFAELRAVLTPEQMGYVKGKLDAMRDFHDRKGPQGNPKNKRFAE
ncbi:MAG: Spy/CpxP family protein refolding chaperone [Deltaproteobacteria bacterium]|nr:Spy/CpxP family protein refolding chaperone [Deltaproteobacteria bacterium]